jgi:hypothetical protein
MLEYAIESFLAPQLLCSGYRSCGAADRGQFITES